MLKTKSLTVLLNDRLDELGKINEPKYEFILRTETGQEASLFRPTLIKGRVRRNSAMTPPMVGLTESSLSYALELLVPCPKAANEHILAVTAILDSLLSEINGTYTDMDGGRAKITIDGGIAKGDILNKGGAGESVNLSVTFNVQWTPDVVESTSAITKDQIEIKLLRRTPYHNRIININEPDVEVARFTSTICGWVHDDVSASLKLKLPVVFNADYNYVQVKEFNGKVTRWFVLARPFVEPDVYTHTLRRDLVREYWEPLLESPVYIEKATLNNNNPLILNKENVSYNQIKTKEILLKEQDCEWAYLYVKPNHDFTTTYIPNDDYDIDLGNTDNILFEKIISARSISVYNGNDTKAYVHASIKEERECKVVEYDGRTDSTVITKGWFYNKGYWRISNENVNEAANGVFRAWYSQINLGMYYDTTSQSAFSGWIGKRVKYKNKVYLINANGYKTETLLNYIEQNTSDWVTFNSLWSANGLLGTGTSDVSADTLPLLKRITLSIGIQEYTFTVQAIPVTTATVTFHSSSINGLPYGIIAIPFDSYNCKDKAGNNIVTDPAICRGVISSLLVDDDDGDGKFIYDAQRLPYSPFIGDVDAVLTKDTTSDFYYVALLDDVVKKPLSVKDENGEYWHYSVTDPKVENQCDMWRLISPNASDTYEFSMVKNKGLSGFQLDMRLKPGKPFIMVSPNWGGYYGEDFDDYRGMVLSGDFSFPRGTSAWLDYIVNNKNYQLIQNRQIENMEINNAIQNANTERQLNFSKDMGLVSSGIALFGGMMSHNQFATGAGLLGGVTTLMNYNNQMASLESTKLIQNSAINYTADMYNYNLQNIKAQPAQIQKVDAFDATYKRFPYLEYYTCTEEEKASFRDKLKYNGMTVMVKGFIKDYLTDTEQYIKGKIMRMEYNIKTNEFNALAEELNMGLFLSI